MENISHITIEKVYRMAETVRCETRLSHKMSCQTIYVVLENFSKLVPTVTSTIDEILAQIQTPLEAPMSLVDDTEDMQQLFTIMKSLNDIRSDTEQRVWELFDDRGDIIGILKKLNSILADADKAISKRFLEKTDYFLVTCLAEYYQLEPRWQITHFMLETFDLLCKLSRIATVVLIETHLPIELANKIVEVKTEMDQIDKMDVEKIANVRNKIMISMRILTNLFSIGDPIPVYYFDTMGKNFILMLLDMIESGADDQSFDDISELLVYFIIVYNLHFGDGSFSEENITIQALSDFDNPKIFLETLLLLFNRGKDPAKFLNHLPHPPNAIIKLITDIFTHESTTNLFYSNDVEVLCHIVSRNLLDISPKNQEKMQWLKLVNQMLHSVDLKDNRRWVDEIKTCLIRYLNDEDRGTEEDERFITNILNYINEKFAS